MKKDKTKPLGIFDKVRSFVITVVAVVAPIMFIYSQFQSLQTLQSDLKIKQDAVKQLELQKESKKNCHETAIALFEENLTIDYLEEYQKCLNALGI